MFFSTETIPSKQRSLFQQSKADQIKAKQRVNNVIPVIKDDDRVDFCCIITVHTPEEAMKTDRHIEVPAVVGE